jgi:hypothetical protein
LQRRLSTSHPFGGHCRRLPQDQHGFPRYLIAGGDRCRMPIELHDWLSSALRVCGPIGTAFSAARQPVTNHESQFVPGRDSNRLVKLPPASREKLVEKGAVDPEHHGRRAALSGEGKPRSLPRQLRNVLSEQRDERLHCASSIRVSASVSAMPRRPRCPRLHGKGVQRVHGLATPNRQKL